MKNKITSLLMLLVIMFTTLSTYATWRQGEMEVRVMLQSKEQASVIASMKLSADYHDGYAVVYVVKSEYEALLGSGLQVEILQTDLDKRNGKGVPDGYYSYQEIINIADSLALHFPGICKKTIAGYSYMNRQLAYLKISDNVMVDEPEAEVLFDAGIHGDEVGASQNAIMYARDLVLGYGNDPEITNLIDNREIYIYLMVNPDGRESMSRYNNNGVDINRDWGYMWNGEGSTDSAFCQNEAVVLRDFILDHEFVIHTTYHSGTEYISCPWSYRADNPEDTDNILFLAGIYSSTSGYANMDYGQGSTGMYYINGASKDYNYGAVGSVSWSMEISYSKQPPASEVSMFYNYNKPAMHAMCEYSGYGIEGMVTDAITGEPIAATILINDFYPTHTDPQVGDFHKYVIGGTYDITVKANGYEEKTVSGIVVEDNTSVTSVEIELMPQEGQYIHYLTLVEIPNNNFDDEGYTPAIYGAPDGQYYSIGRYGFLHVDMGSPIFDKSGMDIVVYEGDDTDEGYKLYAAQGIDGPWYLVGNGMGTTEFDLNTSGLINARYLKIKDDGDGSSGGDDAGFDLDAIAVINPPMAAVHPVPANNSTSATVFSELLWEQGDGGIPSHYELYFGTDNPPSNIVNGEEIQGTAFMPDLPLEYNTTYYWRVDAVNQFGTASGVLWQFTTDGEPDEDFETGDFTLFDWTFTGDAEWIITEDQVRNGSFAAKSGAIDDGQQSTILLAGNCSGFGKISFWQKTSSQASDKLEFYMNGTLMDSWSGDGQWKEYSYNTGPGPYTFEWRYTKNENGQSYDDCAYIDFLYLPEMTTIPPPTVDAGADETICEGDTAQLNAAATNYNTLLWSTNGDGTFSNNSILNPEYYPGEEDITNGGVILTLTVYGTEPATDNVTITIDLLPEAPTEPIGDFFVDYLSNPYEYYVDDVANAVSYEWELIPDYVGEIQNNGQSEIIINFWDGDESYADLHVKAINYCGESIWSEPLEILVNSDMGINDDTTNGDFRITPNPATTWIELKQVNDRSQVEIVDLTGKACVTIEEYHAGDHIDITGLYPGLYLIRILSSDHITTGKFIRK